MKAISKLMAWARSLRAPLPATPEPTLGAETTIFIEGDEVSIPPFIGRGCPICGYRHPPDGICI